MSTAVMRTGGAMSPIYPETFEDVQRLAKMAVKAGLSPRTRNDDDESALAKATAAIMHGLEVGVPPIQAVQGIAIINGKAMMYGDLLTALLWSKGFKIKKWVTGKGDARVGRAMITRPDGEVIEKSFSVIQAKKARLWDTREIVKKQWNGKWEEKPNDGPWFRFDERMLEWRAFGFCVKDGASDATHGMLVLEEAAPEYNEMVDVTPKPTLVSAPDIPDEEEVEAAKAPTTEAAAIGDHTEEAEPDGTDLDVRDFLASLREERGFCTCEQDLIDLREQRAEAIKRLPEAAQMTAHEILADEE